MGYKDARPNTAKLYEMIESGLLSASSVLFALLDFISDDTVGEFAQSEDYWSAE